MRRISLLGSTGSIGVQALEVIDSLEDVSVSGLCANRNIRLLEEQIRKYRPPVAGVYDEAAAADLAVRVADTGTKIVAGEQGLCAVASVEGADSVLTSVVGIAGLLPTMAAIDAGKDILLANKETLVAAGSVVKEAAREKGVRILPVDSEHSAILQCLAGSAPGELRRIILTASGGSFFGKTRAELAHVGVEEALAHPNWSMGQKITIDSATLMNKGLEVIEAHHLFELPYDNIEVVVHRESIIHSMAEFLDGSVIAQMGAPDMRLPIHYAICYPRRIPSMAKPLDLWSLTSLRFAKPDGETFPLLPLAFEAGKKGGTYPAVVNAANEAAVALFLSGKIKFLEISELVEQAYASHKGIINPTLGDIIETDTIVRREVLQRTAR